MACVASSAIPRHRHTRHPSAKTAPAFLHVHQARQRSYRHHHRKLRRGSSFAKIVNHYRPFLVPRRPPPHLQHLHLCLVERPRHHPNGKRRPPHPRHHTTRRAAA